MLRRDVLRRVLATFLPGLDSTSILRDCADRAHAHDEAVQQTASVAPSEGDLHTRALARVEEGEADGVGDAVIANLRRGVAGLAGHEVGGEQARRDIIEAAEEVAALHDLDPFRLWGEREITDHRMNYQWGK